MSTTLPDTRAHESPTRKAIALPAVAERHPVWIVAGICGVGALLFLATLGQSSLFFDESVSYSAASGSMGGVVDAVRYWEVTPPLYYVLLHAWVSLTGADSEVLLRLPSAAAAVALVAATGWLGTVVAGRRAGFVAAALTAASPLVFDYAQQVRSYVFVMLAVTVAAAAVVEWSRHPQRTRWPVLAVGAAVVAILLHYTAALVLVPVVAWAATRPQLTLRARATFLVVCALPGLALLPLLAEQAAQGHQSGTAEYARITPANLFALVGTPFDGRAPAGGLGRQLGALVVVEALALLALGHRFRTIRARGLLVGASVLPVVAVLLASAVAQPAALTRYTAVAAPFMVVAIAAVLVALPRALAGVMAGVAVVACAVGIAAAVLPNGQHPDTRGALAYAGANWEKGDQVFGLGYLGFDHGLDFYARREVAAFTGDKVRGFPTLGDALSSEVGRDTLADGHRMWFVTDPALTETDLRRTLEPVGYEPLEHREYPGSARVQVVLAGPSS